MTEQSTKVVERFRVRNRSHVPRVTAWSVEVGEVVAVVVRGEGCVEAKRGLFEVLSMGDGDKVLDVVCVCRVVTYRGIVRAKDGIRLTVDFRSGVEGQMPKQERDSTKDKIHGSCYK